MCMIKFSIAVMLMVVTSKPPSLGMLLATKKFTMKVFARIALIVARTSPPNRVCRHTWGCSTRGFAILVTGVTSLQEPSLTWTTTYKWSMRVSHSHVRKTGVAMKPRIEVILGTTKGNTRAIQIIKFTNVKHWWQVVFQIPNLAALKQHKEETYWHTKKKFMAKRICAKNVGTAPTKLATWTLTLMQCMREASLTVKIAALWQASRQIWKDISKQCT